MKRLFASLLVVALVAGTGPAIGAPISSSPGEGNAGTQILNVEIAGVQDAVRLEPADPRSPSLQAQQPHVANGIYDGRLAETGWPVHLVDSGEATVGVFAAGDEPVLVTVEDGVLHPVRTSTRGDPGHSALQPADREIQAPTDNVAVVSGPTSGASPADETLQIALEGDYEFYLETGEQWDTYQLKVAHLVSAIYETEVGTPFEVVDQRIHLTENQPVIGDSICSPDGGWILGQFRDYREAENPTQQAQREAAHLFTGKTFEDAPLVGCGYIQELDTPWAYSAAQSIGPESSTRQPGSTIDSNLIGDVWAMAHEVGHNFNGRHALSAPTPGGPLDPVGCYAATIMDHCYGYVFQFSENPPSPPGLSPDWEGQGVVQDGGNVPQMRDYALPRI